MGKMEGKKGRLGKCKKGGKRRKEKKKSKEVKLSEGKREGMKSKEREGKGR